MNDEKQDQQRQHWEDLARQLGLEPEGDKTTDAALPEVQPASQTVPAKLTQDRHERILEEPQIPPDPISQATEKAAPVQHAEPVAEFPVEQAIVSTEMESEVRPEEPATTAEEEPRRQPDGRRG